MGNLGFSSDFVWGESEREGAVSSPRAVGKEILRRPPGAQDAVGRGLHVRGVCAVVSVAVCASAKVQRQ